MKAATADRQIPLFDTTRLAHQASAEALRSIEAHKARMLRKVLAHIASTLTHGATCDEVEVALGMTHQTASARVHELMNLGVIVPNGKRLTRSKRKAVVWVSQKHAAASA